MALGPALAAGFAVQRLFDLLDPVTNWLIRAITGEKKEEAAKFLWAKGLSLGIVSLAIGLVLAYALGLRVLQPFGLPPSTKLDPIITSLVVSAAAEGFNSIMKSLAYAKSKNR